MSNRNWNEKQLQWQKERQLDFNEQVKINANRGMLAINNTTLVNYFIVNVTIRDNQYYFSSFPNNQNTITLNRDTNYIFDLSNPSNLGRKLVISRVPSIGKINDLTYQGIPGNIGSFVSFFVGVGRPSTLYYYDQITKGLGGKIIILATK